MYCSYSRKPYGKIAVVNAAGCGFAVKTKNLQTAGAV
ncbi:PA domain-containing protein, partial [Chryseobacterium sp. CH1]